MNKILSKIIKNAINFKLKESNKQLSLGSSKIGGKPHLPKDFIWPYFVGTNFNDETKNRPLSFIAQINLEEVQKYDLDNVLPHNGMLYFFYDLNTMLWGFDPKDKGAPKVFFVNEKELLESDLPEDLEEQFIVPEMKIKFESKKSLPAFEEYSDVYDEDADWDEYDEVVTQFDIDPAVDPEQSFKLLGYADIIQNSILEECEMVSRGINCGEPVDLPNKLRKDIKQKANDWVLLAQFGTISEEIMFGDCGCIYFYIRKQDLANLNFENIHLCLQCG